MQGFKVKITHLAIDVICRLLSKLESINLALATVTKADNYPRIGPYTESNYQQKSGARGGKNS